MTISKGADPSAQWTTRKYIVIMFSWFSENLDSGYDDFYTEMRRLQNGMTLKIWWKPSSRIFKKLY